VNPDIPEAPGTPPAFVFDPRAGENDVGQNGPVVSARFFIGPDPRTDPADQQVVDAQGNIPEIEMVEIINRNDPKNSPMVNISTDIHRYKLFPREYRAFKQGLDMQSSGIPIKEWLGDNPRTQNLAYFHIHTVEQLASISDSLCSTLGPGTYELRKRAEAYLAQRKDSGFAERVAAENDTLRRSMEAMQADMARLMTIVGAQQTKAAVPETGEVHPAEQEYAEPPRRKPGRQPGFSPKAQMREALRAQDAAIELAHEGE